MRLSRFVKKDGKTLRCGYTTGTCAAAAAKAATLLLRTGQAPDRVSIAVPAGIELTLDVLQAESGEGWARCAVQKDSGDDPDVTNGVWVYALVRRAGTGIAIDGGEGIGRVTKPGLDQPVGAAAINSVPRRMIAQAVEEAAGPLAEEGLEVVISIPAGVELASRTFNPRLGIEGGISVIGTSGIVEPMSDGALLETVRTELNMRRALGRRYAVLTPGNYGESFLKERFFLPEEAVIQCSNFIGDALHMAGKMGFAGALLAGHLGKLVKVAGGMLNTHSRYGDCRMEILCAHAAAAGLPADRAAALLAAATVDEGLRVLGECNIREQTLAGVLSGAVRHARRRSGAAELGVVLFTNAYGLLAQTENADALLARVQEEEGI